MKSRTRSAPQLGVAEWRAAALRALADGGVSAVAIEPIAKSLNVTKGSGYWHFENREALLRAALEEWETRTTERVIARLERIDDPRERLVSLFRQAFTVTLDARVYLALTAADQLPLVAATLCRVSRRRVEFVTRCYEQMKCEPVHATHRALAAYAAYLGVIMLSRHSSALVARKDRDAFIEHLLETLL